MHIIDFDKLHLKFGDYIWIMNEKGEGFWGYFEDHALPGMATFKFRNHSNGKLENIVIANLQRMEKH